MFYQPGIDSLYDFSGMCDEDWKGGPIDPADSPDWEEDEIQHCYGWDEEDDENYWNWCMDWDGDDVADYWEQKQAAALERLEREESAYDEF